MRHVRHFVMVALSMLLTVAMATPAFAGSITIGRDGTYKGSSTRTYQVYKILDADTTVNSNNASSSNVPTYGEGNIAYSAEPNNPWLRALQDESQTWLDVKLTADGTKYAVTLRESVEETAQTAGALAAYLRENMPENLTGGYAAKTATIGTELQVDNGYYLLVASDGSTNLTLVTTNVNITEKNSYLITSKTASETSYNVGDSVTYTVTVTIPAETKLTSDGGPAVILHDKLDEQLTFKSDTFAASMDGRTFDGYTLDHTANETAVNGTTNQADACTFEVEIPVTPAVLGKTITFTYEAELNSSAVDDQGFVNELYGQLGDYTTTPSKPKVYTFDFDLDKQFKVGQTLQDDEALEATFNLYTKADYQKLTDGDDTTSAAPISFIKDANNAHRYVKVDSNDTAGSPEIKVYGKSTITENIRGLEAGTYCLVEKSTSTGYNLLDSAVEVTITDTTNTDENNWEPSHTVSYKLASSQGEASTGTVTVVNQSGTVLPSTGGMGTTVFYVAGGLMIASSLVMLVTKKRMSMTA